MNTILTKAISTLFLTITITASIHSQISVLALSPFQEINQTVGTTKITVAYSRPAIRNRVIFGDLVPYDELWRTGANRNSKLTFSEDVIIGGTRVKSGSYALFTIPRKKEVQVYFYSETHFWDAPTELDTSLIAAELVVPVEVLPSTLQSFTITLDDLKNDRFDLSVMWENTKFSIPIELITEEIVSKQIETVLSGPDGGDYYLAAKYRLESEHNIEQALEWINTAIEMYSEDKWWLLDIKANCLIELGQIEEAKTVIAKGKKLTKAEGTDFGYGYFERLQKRIDEMNRN